MKTFATVAILCMAFLLAGCATLHGNPALRPTYVASAAPEIDKALAAPMNELFAKASGPSSTAHDKLDLGLAAWAGRKLPSPDPADTAAMTALDARLMPRVNAYMAAHSGTSPANINWTRELGLTSDDLALIDRYLGQRLPDFWLDAARASGSSQTLFIYAPPACLKCSGGVMPIETTRYDLDGEMIDTAEQCVLAVRQATGRPVPEVEGGMVQLIAYVRPRILLESMRVVSELGRPDPYSSHEIGAAACGTPEAFSHYVEKLKAAA